VTAPVVLEINQLIDSLHITDAEQRLCRREWARM
jgi:hypothetical protein